MKPNPKLAKLFQVVILTLIFLTGTNIKSFASPALQPIFVNQLSVVAWAPNRLDVFGVGTDNAAYHKYWDGANWWPQTGWQNLGGSLNTDMSVVAWGPYRLDVFALATDDRAYHKGFDGTQWLPSLTGWDSLGGQQFSTPLSVVSWGP